MRTVPSVKAGPVPRYGAGGFPLHRYETARRALAEARRVDEVKDIRDKAEALEAYAKQAKDTQLLRHAREIKLRAEYKAGELLGDMKKNGERPAVGRRKKSSSQSTISELGITSDQSAAWQQLADITPDNFEHAMNEALERGDHVGALRVIEIAKQKMEENPLPPEEIEEIKAAREAEGERIKLCMAIKLALKTFAEHPLSPEEAATHPGLFKGTEYVVEERLERAVDWLNRFHKTWRKHHQ